jgi:hypothetical protein
MKIAIIGAGNVGKALGGTLVKAGHSVSFSTRNAASSIAAAQATGGTAADSIREAVRDADVVILAIPYAAAQAVAAEVSTEAGGKTVIDVTNPTGADGTLITKGISAAEELARLMPGARIVKAFNAIFASVQGNPRAHGRELDAFFATDNERVRDTTAELIHSIGFRPIYVGPLARARELEAIASLNIQMQMSGSGDWRSAWVLVGAPNALVDTPSKDGASTAAR